MGESRARRELSGVGVEAHRSVSELMTRAWQLHRKNGHPAGYVGVCWGPTLDELQQIRDKMMQERMSGKAKPEPVKLHSELGCKCPKHRSTRHVLATCCDEFEKKEAGNA